MKITELLNESQLAVAEGFPQPGESSGKAKQFNPNAKIQTREMTLDQILSSVKGIPYVNEVIQDWDAKDYSWGVTKKVIEYAQYLQKNPQSVANLPPLVVIDGQLNDGAHRLSAINLLQKRMDPKNPLWKQVKLKVNFGTSADVVSEQGVAEGSLEEVDRRGFLKGMGAAAVAGAAGGAKADWRRGIDYVDPMDDKVYRKFHNRSNDGYADLDYNPESNTPKFQLKHISGVFLPQSSYPNGRLRVDNGPVVSINFIIYSNSRNSVGIVASGNQPFGPETEKLENYILSAKQRILIDVTELTRMDQKIISFNIQQMKESVQQGVAEGQLDEIDLKGIKKGLGTAAMAGAMALGGAGAQARVPAGYVDNPDVNRLTGKPNVVQSAPEKTPGASMPHQDLQAVDGVEKTDQGIVITHDGKQYQAVEVAQNAPVPRGATAVKVTQAQMGIRGIGTYKTYLMPNGRALIYSKTAVQETIMSQLLQLDEVSSSYLKRAQDAATGKYNLAADPNNKLPEPEAQALMKFYSDKQKKFGAGAKAKQEQEARARALKKINPSAAAMRKAGIAEEPLAELSPKTLASYKKKAGAQASELDRRAFHKDTDPKQAKRDIAKANKRFSGIVRATKKEFGK